MSLDALIRNIDARVRRMEAFLPGGATAARLGRACAYRTTDQSIADSTWAAVALNANYYDRAAMHDVATNNTRIYARFTGEYRATAAGTFASNATGIRGVAACINAAGALAAGSIVAVDSRAALSSVDTPATCTIDLPMTAGDYVEMFVYQNSGGALALKAYRYSPILSLTFLG